MTCRHGHKVATGHLSMHLRRSHQQKQEPLQLPPCLLPVMRTAHTCPPATMQRDLLWHNLPSPSPPPSKRSAAQGASAT